MNKNGFTFIECILAIGILSIIVITIFPIIESSLRQYSSITVNNELRNIAQSTIEILKSNDSLGEELLEGLKDREYIEVESDYIKNNYNCSIMKIYESTNLIEVEVKASFCKGEDVEEIVFKASVKK